MRSHARADGSSVAGGAVVVAVATVGVRVSVSAVISGPSLLVSRVSARSMKATIHSLDG
jgi:hypothetical protein